MIVDNLKNCHQYYSVNGKFERAFAFIEKAVKENFAVGKYEIDGKEIFASVQEYTSKLKEDGNYEGHRNYIDIQYIISGIEVIEVADISKMSLKTEYNEIKDVEFYDDCNTAGMAVLQSGEYGIFFPHDIHKPGLAFKNSPAYVKKIVVKIKV